MIRCRACHRGITEVYQVSIDAAGELTLVLLDGGGIATPNLVDVLFADPVIRGALWGDGGRDGHSERARTFFLTKFEGYVLITYGGAFERGFSNTEVRVHPGEEFRGWSYEELMELDEGKQELEER